MPINLEGFDTQAPILEFEFNVGRLETSVLLIFSNVRQSFKNDH